MAVIANQNLNLDNIKALVFDFDGTLFNFVPAIKNATQDILKQFDIEHPVDEAVEEFLDLMEEINTSSLSEIVLNSYNILNKISFVKNLSYTKKLQLIFMIYSAYKKYSEQSRLFEGTVELLHNLSKKFDLAIFTSSKRKVILELLEKFGIKEYFKSVLSMEDVNKPKPHPEGILKVVSQLGTYDPDNIIYVGDLKTDIQAARAANIRSIAVYNGLISRQELMKQQPDFFCEHITEISKIFDMPEIEVDKEADLKIDMEFHAKKIKTYVREEFNLFKLLSEVIPNNLEIEHIEKIVGDPLGFIGAIVEDGITKYTHGEFELSSELDVFVGMEEDLLRCLGLIVIHFVNERSRNIIKRTVNSPILLIPSQISLSLLKLSLKSLYPEEYKANFKRIFLGMFQRIIPQNIYEKLRIIEPNKFTNIVLEGCELALEDLGYKKPRNFNFPINNLAFSPFNFVLRGINRTVEDLYIRFSELIKDILENDLRHFPTNN
ncbi:MAG: HAD family hydrolase [Candidatus Helarchaeota archaeon]